MLPGIILLAEQLPLPDRVIGVLHRQRRPPRRPPRPPGRVRAPRSRPPAPPSTSHPPRCGAPPAPAHARPAPAAAARARHGTSAARSNGCARPPRRPRRPGPPPLTPVTGSASPAPPASRTRWYGLPVRGRRTPCAAPRAGPPHPPAPAQRGDVQLAVQPHRQPRCYTSRGPSSWARNHSRCCANDNGTRPGRTRARQRRPRRRRARQPHRQPRRGRRVEHRPHRQLRAQHHPDPADQPHRQQRMAAQVEEIVLGPTRSTPEDLREHLTQDLLAHRGRPPAPGPAGVLRGGQRGRSTFPFTVTGSASSTTTADGTMYSGSRPAAYSRTDAASPAPSCPASPCPAAGTTYPVSRLSPGASSRTITTACATPGCAASTASTSPGSTRNPRILTWSSARPANTSSPSARPPGQVPGPVHPLPRPRTGTRRTAPRSAPPAPHTPAPAPPPPRTAPRPPRPAPAPATGPARTPGYWRTGRPIGSGPVPHTGSSPATSSRHTVASVGPYAFTSRTARHADQRRRQLRRPAPHPAPASVPHRRQRPPVQRPPAPPAAAISMRHPARRQEPGQLRPPASSPPRRHHQHRPRPPAPPTTPTPTSSKLTDANCATRSPAPSPRTGRIAATRFTSPAVRHHHPLRHPRRPRRVDHIRRMTRPPARAARPRCRRRSAAPRGHPRPAASIQRRDRRGRQPAAARRGR